jgi:hypothetical protein
MCQEGSSLRLLAGVPRAPTRSHVRGEVPEEWARSTVPATRLGGVSLS